jgi:YVTN family beta-propeller protein
MRLPFRVRELLAPIFLALASLLVSFGAVAQTVPFPPAPTVKMAVNPITNKVYTLNEFDNTVSVFDANTGNTKTIAVGPRPQYIAVNPVTNKVYVNNSSDATLSVIDGATDTNLTVPALAIGSHGPISVDPVHNIVYIVRLTGPGSDEVTYFNGDTNSWYTIATESFQPIAIAINPLTSTLYVAHYATGDVRIISSVFNPADDFPQTFSLGMWSKPFAIAVNPVTNRIYVITEDSRGPIAVIDGATRTADFPLPASGHAVGPKGLAVNPVTNRVYALFNGEVIVMDGATNTYTYVPVSTGSGQAEIAVNPVTNKVYIASDNGLLTILDGDTNTTSAASVPAGTNALGIDPIRNVAYIFSSLLAAVSGSASEVERAMPLTVSIAPQADDSTGPDPVFTITASSTFAPNALPASRVYVQLDSRAGPWVPAAGSGPFTATFGGLAGGSHTLYAFAVDGQDAPLSTGDVSILRGTIASYTFTVTGSTKAQPSVSLASSANPSLVGHGVTFTASVAGSAGEAAPTGSVDFKDGGVAIAGCTGVALASGTAACTTSALGAGSHTITAHYAGDATYDAATSDAVTQAVQRDTATASVSSSPNPAAAGTAVNLAATVTGAGVTPTGTVDFRDGGTPITGCTGVALSSGGATCATTSFTAGTHSLTAVYSGDARYNGATSPAITQTMTSAGGSLALSTSMNPSRAGAPVTFTATITGSSGTPTGTVDIRDGGTTIPGCGGLAVASRSPTSSDASCTVTTLAAGSHSITAVYSGDSRYAAATSGTLPQSVTMSSPTFFLGTTANPSRAGSPVTFTAVVSGDVGAATGTVDFLDGNVVIPGCSNLVLQSATANCTTAQLAVGSHSIAAAYSGDDRYVAATSPELDQVVQAQDTSGPARASLSVTSIDFGGQSMGTTSGERAIVVTNSGSSPLTIRGVRLSDPRQFAQASDCASLAPGAACTIRVTFTPAVAAGDLGSTASVAATLAVDSDGEGSPNTVALAGTAEKSLVTHFYASILRRAPDAGGKAYWEQESLRMQQLGANPNETWFAMAAAFYFSPEYVALARDDAGFVQDLYATFFNRAADADGLSFWTAQIGAGMPRENVLTSFMFSAEFVSFTRNIFGDTAARAEVDTVMDFYRGFHGRLPDSGGFDYWVQRFRAAQCVDAGAVYSEVQSIAAEFLGSAEYANRARDNARYVADLYNGIHRRGGDPDGIRYWIGQLDSGARSRDQLRTDFIGSPEFANRVNAIVSQGCMR